VGPFTVLQSIAFSGGLRDTARTNEVVVIRRDNDYKPMAIPVNLRTVIDGTDMRQDIVLAPYDIVFVPKSPIGNAATWVDLYLRRTILVLPQEFFLYYSAVKR
jgi:protein involved in polysaccharide export with SLBB domain